MMSSSQTEKGEHANKQRENWFFHQIYTRKINSDSFIRKFIGIDKFFCSPSQIYFWAMYVRSRTYQSHCLTLKPLYQIFYSIPSTKGIMRERSIWKALKNSAWIWVAVYWTSPYWYLFFFVLLNNYIHSAVEYYTYETTEEQGDQRGSGKKSEERGEINNWCKYRGEYRLRTPEVRSRVCYQKNKPNCILSHSF